MTEPSLGQVTNTIPVLLKTRTSYVIPSEKYMIPTSWRRFHLSQLINKVLNLSQPVPFDFLVQGEMLRTSLHDWCIEKGFEGEETLEIEYIESLLPPEKISSIPHSDWVSSISCQMTGHFLTGSYDSIVRVYNDRQELVHSISGHSGPVSSVCVIPSAADSMESRQLIGSASYDTTARIVSIPDTESDSTDSTPITLASLHLHTSAISSIASNSTGTVLLTSGWDHLIGVWTTDIPEEDEASENTTLLELDRKKRRKVSRKDESGIVQQTPKRKAPQGVLKSHTSRISSVAFSPLANQSNLAYSCGWDFSMRSWDVEAGVCTSTRVVAEKAMLNLTVTADGRTIVTANGDRTVSLFSASSPAPPTQLPHTAIVTSVSSHSTSPHHIIAGSMDGKVRIWDLRSTKGAVESFVATGEGKGSGPSRVLGLDWSGPIIGCAGELGIDIFRASVSI
ncbi:ribosome biogenesis protein ytm1 [Tulasnella sp. 418]|nr:ribosome biogenesis protein ytm1 [Tulasnella sp. 418]